MKPARFPLLALLMLLLVPGLAGAQQEKAPLKTVDRIVAVVNNDVITRYQLDSRVDDAIQELKRRGTQPPPRAQLERQVLERMITERVQLQFARTLQIKVDDLDLDRTVSRIAEANKMTLPEFRRVFERDGIPFSRFREDLRNQIIIRRLREREVDRHISVAESDVDAYLAAQARSKRSSDELHLLHILVRVPDQATPEEIEKRRARAEQVVKRLKAGADFASLAAAYSDAPDALQGGDMGWRNRDHLPDLFVRAAAGMQPGDVSPVLRSPAGFHVLKLLGRRSGISQPKVVQNHVRQILIRTGELVSAQDAKRKLEQLRERILNGADFGELARQYSEDSSASKGGDLGWIYPGDTVPEFERAVNELKPGEISQPVKTPFGWHLIQLLGRRTADVSPKRRRMEARRVLRERKSDEAYQEWLRELRDRAYVEYRLDDR